jgi:hypothetical protein
MLAGQVRPAAARGEKEVEACSNSSSVSRLPATALPMLAAQVRPAVALYAKKEAEDRSNSSSATASGKLPVTVPVCMVASPFSRSSNPAVADL